MYSRCSCGRPGKHVPGAGAWAAAGPQEAAARSAAAGPARRVERWPGKRRSQLSAAPERVSAMAQKTAEACGPQNQKK